MQGRYMSTDKTQPVQTQTQNVLTPIFQIGISRVGWKFMSSSDRGLVMGMRYLWAEYQDCWQWQCYIALDSDSPSFLLMDSIQLGMARRFRILTYC